MRIADGVDDAAPYKIHASRPRPALVKRVYVGKQRRLRTEVDAGNRSATRLRETRRRMCWLDGGVDFGGKIVEPTH